MKVKLHPEYQSLKGAKGRFGLNIPVYDDGYGDLYILRNSMGVAGIVRSSSWETAYSICEDEFFPEAPSWEELKEEFKEVYISSGGGELWRYENPGGEFHKLSEAEKAKEYARPGITVPFPYPEGHHLYDPNMSIFDHPCWSESYGFRPGGPREGDEHNHGIYEKDLNGDRLDLFTEIILDSYEISLDAPMDWDEVRADIMAPECSFGQGIYIPHLFCANLCEEAYQAQDKTVQSCIDNLKPESSVHEYKHYEEDWTTILDKFKFDGHVLHQDGDLWLLDYGMFCELSEYYGIDENRVRLEIFGF